MVLQKLQLQSDKGLLEGEMDQSDKGLLEGDNGSMWQGFNGRG